MATELNLSSLETTLPESATLHPSPSSSSLASRPKSSASSSKAMFSLQACAGSGYISLNVGGKVFLTTRSTLTKEPDSMLAMMFGEGTSWYSTTDKDGAYLIDRTPEYFAPVLHYLRTGNIIIDSNIDTLGVLEEARFFGVFSLVEHLEGLINEREMRARVNFTRAEFIRILVQAPRNDQIRCQGLNLEGIDLSCLDLRLINFKMTNLRNANLRDCDCAYVSFECADLTGANLEGANLGGAIFSRAVLENTNMRRCSFEDPVTGKGADFGGANMNGAQMEDSILVKANLRVATLRGANLTNCNLRGAILAGADLKDCNLSGCNLTNANLRGANVMGAKFDQASPVHMSNSI